MVKPNAEQMRTLAGYRDIVLQNMHALGIVGIEQQQALIEVPLGVLRSNATQRHGATRWRRLSSGDLELEVVDLHPNLLVNEWADYAHFVLFHEYLHALGYRQHNSAFRSLEALWPDGKGAGRGKEFTRSRRLARARWMWLCRECGERYPRQKKGAGRYFCRTCNTALVDEAVQDIQ